MRYSDKAKLQVKERDAETCVVRRTATTPVRSIVHETYAHLMPDADERGRKAMNAFFAPTDGSCALDVPSEVPS
jgi:hypothetical protein